MTVRSERLGPAQMPLADRGRGVALVAEHLPNRDLFLCQPRHLRREEDVRNTRPHGIPPRQQGGTRGTAERCGRVEVGESQALGGHPIQVRGPDRRRAVDAKVAVTEVVGEDQDEVRLFRSVGAERGSKEQKGKAHRGHYMDGLPIEPARPGQSSGGGVACRHFEAGKALQQCTIAAAGLSRLMESMIHAIGRLELTIGGNPTIDGFRHSRPRESRRMQPRRTLHTLPSLSATNSMRDPA